MPDFTHEHILQQYLSKRLSPEEEIAFEIAMLDDPSITENVVLTHALKSGLRQSPAKPDKVSSFFWQHKLKIVSALAATFTVLLFLPMVFKDPVLMVSPGIVYVEDFRSHVTEVVPVEFAPGEAYKFIVTDAPPDFSKPVTAIIRDEANTVMMQQQLLPNRNNEINLLIYADQIDSGQYRLTLQVGTTELNRFTLDVIKE